MCSTLVPEPLEARKGKWFPGTGVTDGCQMPCGCWEWNLGPLLLSVLGPCLVQTHTDPVHDAAVSGSLSPEGRDLMETSHLGLSVPR